MIKRIAVLLLPLLISVQSVALASQKASEWHVRVFVSPNPVRRGSLIHVLRVPTHMLSVSAP